MKLRLSAVALLATSAASFAADLPSRSAPLPPPAPVAATGLPTLTRQAGLWNGFYAGGLVAWDFAARDPALSGPSGGTLTGAAAPGQAKGVEGFGGGLYAGYNMQFGAYVAGVEADAQMLLDPWSKSATSAFASSAAGATGSFDLSARAKRLGDASLRLRAGYALARDMLIYATGGLAVTQVEREVALAGAITVPGAPDATYTLAGAKGLEDKIRLGWTIGAGLDYMFMPAWSLRAEYRYSSFGQSKANLTSACSTGCGESAGSVRFVDAVHTARLGVAYHFGGR